jgi:hypothetical protein
MKWLPGGQSEDIEDVRDENGGGGLPLGGGHGLGHAGGRAYGVNL